MNGIRYFQYKLSKHINHSDIYIKVNIGVLGTFCSKVKFPIVIVFRKINYVKDFLINVKIIQNLDKMSPYLILIS